MKMNIETVPDLADKLADWLGIYGGCKNLHEDDDNCTYDKCNPFCCRIGFTGAMEERIRESVENEKMLGLEPPKWDAQIEFISTRNLHWAIRVRKYLLIKGNWKWNAWIRDLTAKLEILFTK